MIYAFIFTVFISLRPDQAGNDTNSYINTYRAIYDIKSSFKTGLNYHGSADPIFWPAMALLKSLGISHQYFILSVGSISCILFYLSMATQCKILKLSPWYATFFSVLILYTYQLTYMGNLLRISIAYPICALAFIYAQKSTSKSLVLGLISIGFHLSCIIVLPYILITHLTNKSKINKNKILLAMFFSIIVSSFNENILFLISNFSFAPIGEKILLYQAHSFNIKTIFTTITFWFIALHFIILLFYGKSRTTLIFFYLFFIILILSPIPKMAERYFPLILIIMPAILYSALKERYTTKNVEIFMTTLYIPIGFILINTESVRYTLWI